VEALTTLSLIVRTFFDQSFGLVSGRDAFVQPDRWFPGTRLVVTAP